MSSASSMTMTYHRHRCMCCPGQQLPRCEVHPHHNRQSQSWRQRQCQRALLRQEASADSGVMRVAHHHGQPQAQLRWRDASSMVHLQQDRATLALQAAAGQQQKPSSVQDKCCIVQHVRLSAICPTERLFRIVRGTCPLCHAPEAIRLGKQKGLCIDQSQGKLLPYVQKARALAW